MDILSRLRRMSVVQLKALSYLAANEHGLAHSTGVGKQMGVMGKSLGGVFSSLSRQKIKELPLVLPWGKGGEGRGLRWRLNPEVVNRQDLQRHLKELLAYE